MNCVKSGPLLNNVTSSTLNAAFTAGERRYVFDTISGTLHAQDKGSKFIFARIPFAWMWRANRLPGKAAHVALSLWFISGVKKTGTFKLTAEAVDLAGCGRKALYAALVSMEKAGLISVVRRSGSRPIVTLIRS